MSKELDAFRRFGDNAKFDNKSDYYLSTQYIDDSEIIETALEILEQLQIIIGAEKIEDLPKLALETENACYSACYNLKEVEKKLKALEIIKEKEVNVANFIYACKCSQKDLKKYHNCDSNYELACLYVSWNGKTLTREEYDLLKEVLL